MIQLDPNSDQYLYGRGNVYHDLEMYDLSIRDFTSAIKNNPNEAYFYDNRAHSYYKLGNYEKAIHDLDTAIQIEEGYFEAPIYQFRGSVY